MNDGFSGFRVLNFIEENESSEYGIFETNTKLRFINNLGVSYV